MNNKVLKLFIISCLLLVTTSCFPAIPPDQHTVEVRTASLEDVEDSLKWAKYEKFRYYDLNFKDLCGDFLVSNYRSNDIIKFNVSAASIFENGESMIGCRFGEEYEIPNVYMMTPLKTEFKIKLVDDSLRDVYFLFKVNQNIWNILSSIEINTSLIEKNVKLYYKTRSREFCELKFESLYTNIEEEVESIKLTIEDYYTFNNNKYKVRETIILIEHFYYRLITDDGIDYNQLEVGMPAKDILYLVSDEYSQNEKYEFFDLKFKSILDEYINKYEKFEVRA